MKSIESNTTNPYQIFKNCSNRAERIEETKKGSQSVLAYLAQSLGSAFYAEYLIERCFQYEARHAASAGKYDYVIHHNSVYIEELNRWLNWSVEERFFFDTKPNLPEFSVTNGKYTPLRTTHNRVGFLNYETLASCSGRWVSIYLWNKERLANG